MGLPSGKSQPFLDGLPRRAGPFTQNVENIVILQLSLIYRRESHPGKIECTLETSESHPGNAPDVGAGEQRKVASRLDPVGHWYSRTNQRYCNKESEPTTGYSIPLRHHVVLLFALCSCCSFQVLSDGRLLRCNRYTNSFLASYAPCLLLHLCPDN